MPEAAALAPAPAVGLRRRLLQVAVLPVLAVGALAAILGGLFLRAQAEREIEVQLEYAAQDALGHVRRVADRMAGYGIAIAQRRDIRASLAVSDATALQRELAELYWDLRSNDVLLRALAVTDRQGRVVGGGAVGGQAAAVPQPRILAQGDRAAGLLLAGDAPVLGATTPVIDPESGQIAGAVHALARLDGALTREIAAELHGHVALFVKGALVGSTLPLAGERPEWLEHALRASRPVSGILRAEDASWRARVHPLLDTGEVVRGHLVVFMSDAAPHDWLVNSAVTLAVTGGIILFLALPLTWTAARRLAMPLEALARTLHQLEAGNRRAASEPVPEGSPAEVLALAEAVERFRESLAEREALAGQLAWMANYDPVAGIPNRNLFHDRLAQALSLARRQGTLVALHLIDLDRFKEVNDTLGHGAGDAVLKEVGTRLSSLVRANDTVARLGGDEFAVIQTGMDAPGQAMDLAARLVPALSEPLQLEGRPVAVGASIGVSLAEGRGPEAADALVSEADLALYRAKEDGRGVYRLFNQAMDLQARERRALEADLRDALAQGQLRLVFQPQFALPGRELCGAEALLRWRHPTRGDVPPDLFIGMAEQVGLIVPIGDYVLREAARAAAAWPGIRIAVNVSPLQLRHDGFLASLEQALALAGLPGDQLEIEVTEGVMVTGIEATVTLFDAVRALGVRVALDDFGSGYSSLGQLQRFRFDKIKLDRAFVRPLGGCERATALVRAVAGMTRALGVRMNAEGVETEAQAAILAAEGCAEVQGYLFGRPAEHADFAALVARRAGTAQAA